MSITTKWEKILLDTSAIVMVLNFKKNGKEENKFANKLIEYLASSEAQVTDKKIAKRKFYISAISIAELIDSSQSEGVDKTKTIVQALNADNIEIVDFDEDVANLYSLKFIDKLGVNYQKEILTKWGAEKSKVNREILTKDLMILGCGLYKEIDVVLTHDKGMYRIGKECGINVVYIDAKYFHFNDTYIFEFYVGNCDKEILK